MSNPCTLFKYLEVGSLFLYKKLVFLKVDIDENCVMQQTDPEGENNSKMVIQGILASINDDTRVKIVEADYYCDYELVARTSEIKAYDE